MIIGGLDMLINEQTQNAIRVTLDEDLHVWYGAPRGGMRGRCSRPAESAALFRT